MFENIIGMGGGGGNRSCLILGILVLVFNSIFFVCKNVYIFFSNYIYYQCFFIFFDYYLRVYCVVNVYLRIDLKFWRKQYLFR